MTAITPSHLTLFGQVAWRTGSQFHVVPPGVPTSIVVSLAVSRRVPVDAGVLLDRLWSEPPSSGINAVQRHVSRLRTHLRAVDIDPGTVIETVGAGYRLASGVTTDYDLLGSHAAGHATDQLTPIVEPASGESPCWWLEPLVGVPPDKHKATRAYLTSASLRACGHWVERSLKDGRAAVAVEVLLRMTEYQPGDLELWGLLREAALAAGDTRVLGVARAALDEGGDRHSNIQLPDRWLARPGGLNGADEGGANDPEHYRNLGRCGALWADGDIDAAFEALDEVTAELSHDVVHRLTRCLVWIPPDDGFGRTMWLALAALSALMPEQAERCVVSLDAYALEQMDDAIEVADREIAAAGTIQERVRSLRVRFMVGLGHPMSEAQRSVVDQLTQIDHPDGRVESLRFAALLAAKLGEFDRALEQFDRYDDLVGRLWPEAMDDFKQLAHLVIGLSPGVDLGVDPVLPSSLLPITTNNLTADMATLWNCLDRGLGFDSSVMYMTMHRAMSGVPPECAAAFELYWRMRSDGVETVAETAHQLLVTVERQPCHRYRHGALAVLGRYAVETGDAMLAGRIIRLLLPWAGEYLGLWPFDVLFGPADELLDQLVAIGSTD